ncbi:MAG: hypothetical protein Q8M96_19505 [Rubrivivax sp.]|nr:hypothetical protein [Rubrivivax sp.]
MRLLRSVMAVWAAAAALSSCAAPAASPAAAQTANAGRDITHIVLERDCFGCATGSVLELQRDGTAQLTVTGKARHRTQDRVSRGVVTSADFDAIARLAVAQGFFAWQDEYADATLQDGAWTTLRITRADQAKQVFSREGAGPQGLKDLQAAVLALQARIRFQPD